MSAGVGVRVTRSCGLCVPELPKRKSEGGQNLGADFERPPRQTLASPTSPSYGIEAMEEHEEQDPLDGLEVGGQ